MKTDIAGNWKNIILNQNLLNLLDLEKMKKYKVQSGELKKTIKAKSRTEAVLKAVKRHRKSLSQIIMITEKGKKEFDESYFFATDDILKKLNFEIVKE